MDNSTFLLIFSNLIWAVVCYHLAYPERKSFDMQEHRHEIENPIGKNPPK